VRRLDRLASMSNMKYDALVQQGVEVGERVPIPDDLIPADARVEMDAKKAAGYFAPGGAPGLRELAEAKGRALGE
jgi:GTP cyclohydrolase II